MTVSTCTTFRICGIYSTCSPRTRRRSRRRRRRRSSRRSIGGEVEVEVEEVKKKK